MTNIFKRQWDRLFIDRGQVFCPIRGQDTDIEVCAACKRLAEIDTDGKQPFVRCRLEPVSPIAHMWF